MKNYKNTEDLIKDLNSARLKNKNVINPKNENSKKGAAINPSKLEGKTRTN